MPEPELVIEAFVAPMFDENGYLVYRRVGGACWIVDPSFDPQPTQLLEAVSRNQLHLAAVILTHGHADHISGVDKVHPAATSARLLIAEDAKPALTDPVENLSADFGMPLTIAWPPDGGLEPGDTLDLDGLTWSVLETSGHSPGGRSLYCAEAGVVLVGDALFAGSIGRHDFHHSDEAALVNNIRTNLLTLPPATRVYSGHGPVTTIGRERETNPFVGDAAWAGRA